MPRCGVSSPRVPLVGSRTSDSSDPGPESVFVERRIQMEPQFVFGEYAVSLFGLKRAQPDAHSAGGDAEGWAGSSGTAGQCSRGPQGDLVLLSHRWGWDPSGQLAREHAWHPVRSGEAGRAAL